MSTWPEPKADAPLVVFDFDHTLYDGDSGSHLFAWLIRRSWLRTLVALLATPVLGPMVAFLPTRRWGISGYAWIGSFGMHRVREFDRVIDRYVATHREEIAARLLPTALEVFANHRARGDRVVVATGAPPELARAILGFVAHADVPVVGTEVGPRLGGVKATRHCHNREKVRMLRSAAMATSTWPTATAPPTCRCCRPRASRWWSIPSAGARRSSGRCCRPGRRSSTGAARTAAARHRPGPDPLNG